MHKAKQVLLCNHVIVVEAVVALKHKLFHLFDVFIYKHLNVIHEGLFVESTVCKAEPYSLFLARQLFAYRFSKLSVLVRRFYILLKGLFVYTVGASFGSDLLTEELHNLISFCR